MSGKSSGQIFNNGMDDFSYPNRDVNYFGLKETPTNFPAPGKRAISSMSPVILIDKKTNLPIFVVGAAGGSKIISALSLAILRFLSYTQDIKEIIDAPRFHHQMIPNVLEYEYGITSNIALGLKVKGHETKRYRHRGTIINAIKKSDNSICAISDYRKDSSGVAGY
jgi:gamma-glutamyltranspeptidase/glutathione hydrolase/leukotriene-C4 hydrolase